MRQTFKVTVSVPVRCVKTNREDGMFTDWTMTDPTYFYIRGALFGTVASTLFWVFVVPWVKRGR